jgi:hypothetical protein
VFVHHQLSASFDKLKAEARQQLFLKNKAIYEEKWGEWIPHAYRQAGVAEAGAATDGDKPDKDDSGA